MSVLYGQMGDDLLLSSCLQQRDDGICESLLKPRLTQQYVRSLLVDFRNHAKKGTYCLLSQDPCIVNEDGSSLESAATEIGARFCMDTPAVQSPLSHWIGYFPMKAQIDNAYAEQNNADALKALLQQAIAARDAEATQYAWWNLKKCTDGLHLGLSHLWIDVPQVHFLLFRAQVPDLFCAIVHQHTSWMAWFAELHGQMIDGNCAELVPLVAALMEAVHYVKRVSDPDACLCSNFAEDVVAHNKEREDWDGHAYTSGNGWWRSEIGAPPGPGHDTWWHRALTLLIPALPLWPGELSRYIDTEMIASATSILERAALCSELSLVAFESIMTHCEFSQYEMSRVLRTVLLRGNVRGPKAIRVATLLYAELWKACVGMEPFPEGGGVNFLRCAWADLFVASTEQRFVELHSTSAKGVLVESYRSDFGDSCTAYPSICEQMSKIRVDAAQYAEIANNFLEVHVHNMSRKGDNEAMCAICVFAIKVALWMGRGKTYLVQLLIEFARNYGFLDAFLKVPEFLVEILVHHVGCWNKYVKLHFRNYFSADNHAQRELWEKPTSHVMKFLVTRRITHAVNALLDTLVYLPSQLMTEEALVSFVGNVCVPVFKRRASESITPTEDRVRRCWEALNAYLLAGGVGQWQFHVLKAGLREASRNASGAAAEVFLSAPWSVEPDADDVFSLAIVAALLVPGEKEVLATGARFDKRKRGEEERGLPKDGVSG